MPTPIEMSFSQNSLLADKNSNTWFRNFLRGKTRIAIAWIFAFLLGFSARQFPSLPGIALCFLGATLRFWASGYLRKDTKPAIGGPYAFVRNPLYLGTYLMAVGTALAIENPWILASLTVTFAIIYHFIILDEEIKLQKIFGAPYLEYCQHVSRFFPRPALRLGLPFKKASPNAIDQVNPVHEHRQFSWETAMKNKAYEAYATFIALMAFVAGMALFWEKLGPSLS